MSNSLAIATVTSALQRRLESAAGEAVPGTMVKITCPKSSEGSDTGPEIDICLYQVTPNLAFRNQNLPYRDSKGKLRQNTQVGLNLHYIMTFLGNETTLEPQRLLGSVVNVLEAKPILDPTLIQETIDNNTTFLAGSNLVDQIEQVKFSPEALSLEELSKLWSVFFQVPYTLSVAYQASVVLIEGEELAEPAPLVEERYLEGFLTLDPITVPTYKAEGMDTDEVVIFENTISGPVHITKALDESDLDYYDLYWGQKANTKLPDTPKIAQLFKTGKDITYTLPTNTLLPEDATHILLYTSNKVGENPENLNSALSRFPYDISNLSLWLDASDETTIIKDSDGNISKWRDKSGNNYNAIQPESRYQPKLLENAVGENSVIDFKMGINSTRSQYLSVSNSPALTRQDITLFSVIKPTTVSGNVIHQGFNYSGQECGWALGRGPGHPTMGAVPDNSVVFGAANNTDNFNDGMLQFSMENTSPINQIHIITVVKSGNVINAWVNHDKIIDEESIEPVDIAYAFGTDIILARSVSAWVEDYQGWIAEQIIYPLAFDETAVSFILTYLTKKWLI